MTAALALSEGRQLFFDDLLIAESSLRREWHLPEVHPASPVLKPETLLELNGGLKPVAAPFSDGLWYDPEAALFKLWYHAGWFDGLAYATSTNGIDWTRPKLDVEKGTNRVLAKRDGYARDGATVWLDQNATEPAERYKLFAYFRRRGDTPVGEVHTSGDGIHWRRVAETGPLGDNSSFYNDPFRRRWVWSIRAERPDGRTSAPSGSLIRTRVFREHSQFLGSADWRGTSHFGERTMETDDDDTPDSELGYATQLYHMTAVAYESVLLGSFLIHRGPPNGVCERERRPKITEITIGFSRDGINWVRPDRRPFIACSRQPGTWNFGYIHPAGGICAIVRERLYFYFGAWSGTSPELGRDMYAGGSTGLATLRRDGFVSLEADSSEGYMTTPPILFRGAHLFVNADASRGELVVEALDNSGRTLPGYAASECMPIRADETRQRVRWRNRDNLTPLNGQPVRLRFRLARSSLYSFWASPAASGASLGYVAAGGPGLSGVRDIG